MNLYDVGYAGAVVAAAPVWLLLPSARRKVLGALRNRMGEVPRRADDRPCVLIHAVSLGEINATRALIDLIQSQRPDVTCVVSATTETGFARAQELYGNRPNVMVIRYPLDFSGAVRRTLDAIRPDLVVLMELEVWPNFIRHCIARGIRVLLVNGRLTESSYRNYRRGRWLVARTFRRLSGLCVQDMTYAKRFIALGVPPERVLVTGTMKFDTAQLADRVEGDRDLAAAVGLWPADERIWVCGSTGPGEEQIVLRVYRELIGRFPRLRLVIVPRHPQRFDEVAQLIESHRFKVVRRSRNDPPPPPNQPIPPVVLGDTMGELRQFYSLAQVVFVGRSLVDLGHRQHGSDMIEPAALGKPCVVGPYTTNFAEVMRKFLAADAMMVVPDEPALAQAMAVLLSTPDEARAMGLRARQVVASEQGATARNTELILAMLRRVSPATPTPSPQ